MRHFAGLEDEEKKISKKIKKNRKIKLWSVISYVIVIFSSIAIAYNLPLLYKYVALGVALIGLISFFILIQVSENNKLSLKQFLLHNINYLRNMIDRKEDLDVVKKKLNKFISRYNFQKRRFYGLDVEKKINDFFNGIILHLKYYSKKDYLDDDDKIKLNMAFEIILERILKEDFTLEGLGLKKPEKGFRLSQIISNLRSILKYDWTRIILLLIFSFFIVFILKLIKVISEISLGNYTLIFMALLGVYLGFFHKKTN